MQATLILSALLLPTSPTLGGESDELPEAPIAAALAAQSEDVRVFNDHLVTLASPFMEGRLPGTKGMEVAKDYVEFWLRAAGLEAPFVDDAGQPSFRQPFPLDGFPQLVGQELEIDGTAGFVADRDYTALSVGSAGDARGHAVFVGYSIPDGPDGWSSYAEGDDLTGKIAVMFRFEPMGETGASLWTDRGWSNRASFSNKVRAAAKRGAAGIVIVNTPGADDDRSKRLPSFSMGRSSVDVPVVMVMPNVAEALFASLGRSVLEMRAHADAGEPLVPLEHEVRILSDVRKEDVVSENVAGLLRGRGALKDELIVIGAHMDHLGMGFFGSRDPDTAGRELYPGADDNASGTAGILLIADKLVQDYAALPTEQPLRSVLVIAFNAEESGLNGAKYYVEHPIVDPAQHALMMNFDMIGRIENKRLAVSGVGTAKGMAEWIEPIFDRSPLDEQSSSSGGGGSDHLAFLSAGIPSLFGIIADFHQDYHTPRDTSDKINRVDAVEAAYLWREIALAAAQRPEPFEFVQQRSAGGARGNIKVRFGIAPGNYGDEAAGVAVGDVTAGGSAEAAGVQAGDRLITWDGDEIEDIRAWMGMLAEHEPGDAVLVGIERDGEQLELRVVLQAAGGR